MTTTVPAIVGKTIPTFNPNLGGECYFDPQGKLHCQPIGNFDLMKSIGDMMDGLKKWVIDNLVPFIIGVLAIVFMVFVLSKVFG